MSALDYELNLFLLSQRLGSEHPESQRPERPQVGNGPEGIPLEVVQEGSIAGYASAVLARLYRQSPGVFVARMVGWLSRSFRPRTP